ncbi:MAG TPA: hypothetical protein VEC17_03780 [Candidatus Binatia bacterium]|nr:hypothetical protein [Candidatus Binatia bacterium]
MSEFEKGFNPENQDVEHDITQGYVNSSPSEFIDYLKNNFTSEDRLTLHLHISEVNGTSLINLFEHYAKAKAEIYGSKHDYIELVSQHPALKFNSRIDWKLED